MSEQPRTSWLVPATVGLVALLIGAGVGMGVMGLLKSGGGPPGGPGAPGGGPPMGGPPPASVVVGDAVEMDLRRRFEVIGRLHGVQRATVAAEVGGKVVELPVDVGDQVIGGQTVLARIEDVWVRLALQQAEAEVAAAQADVDQAQLDYDYIESLAASKVAKPRELHDARATLEANQARLEAAVAMRDRAKEQLQRVTVVAPFDAAVVRKHSEVGEWLEPGNSLFELVSRGEIDAVVDVPEHIVNRITLGEQIELILDPEDRRLAGKVVSINPSGDNNARTYPVKVRMDDEAGLLKPGMSVTALMPLEAKAKRITVPRDAVQFAAQGPVVWVAAPPMPEPEQAAGDGGGGEAAGTPAPEAMGPPMPTAQSVPVVILFGHEDRFAVEPLPSPGTELLDDGAQVVVQGAEMIYFPGQPLIMRAEGSVADAAPAIDADRRPPGPPRAAADAE